MNVYATAPEDQSGAVCAFPKLFAAFLGDFRHVLHLRRNRHTK